MISRRDVLVSGAATLVFPVAAAHSQSKLVRRDVMDMAPTDQFFTDYAAAVKQMHTLKDGRNWTTQARIHADHCHHGEIEFLHWHRHYIRFFEKICAELSGNPSFALPYWNWSKNSGRIPAPFFDIPELNVEHWKDAGIYDGQAWGPIDTIPKRGLNKTRGLLDDPVRGGAFTLQAINNIKGFDDPEQFHSALEGSPHNTGHTIAGSVPGPKAGHIGDGLSPLDPIFWLHHCMVDRVWAEWQGNKKHQTPDPQATYADNFYDEKGNRVTVTSTTALDFRALGYTYDVLPDLAVATAAESLVLDKQVLEIQEIIKPTQPPAVSVASNTNVSRANIATNIPVTVDRLEQRAKDLKSLEQAGLTLPLHRVLAKLTIDEPPHKDDLVVNVFVDCPYLSPTTPYTDPHYAGSFSFFGKAGQMQGMDMKKQRTYVLDITSSVRENVTNGQIRVQLMPVAAISGVVSESSFRVSSVEIVVA